MVFWQPAVLGYLVESLPPPTRGLPHWWPEPLGPDTISHRPSDWPVRLCNDWTKLKTTPPTFFKHENVRGGQVIHNMNLKVREKPFSVYLGFVKPHTGREVIYVAGQSGSNLLAHGTGIEKSCRDGQHLAELRSGA